MALRETLPIHPGDWSSLNEYLAILVGGSLPAVRYRLVSDGVTVTAYDQTGVSVSSGTDGAAVLTAVMPPAASAGATIEFRNDGFVFPWGSVPLLPPGVTQKLSIVGNGVIVRLSAAGPRFLDFGRTADYQTFQHIEVTDFQIDCNNIDAATHTVIGNRTTNPSVDQLRSNFSDIAVRRIRAYNIPSSATGRSGISIGLRQSAGGEGTQNYMRDILIEDVSLDGGTGGFLLTGTAGGVAVTNGNYVYDNLRLIRCKHTDPAATVKPINSASFQIGQNVPGGYVLLRDCYGEYQKDVGVEIDNATRADIEDCEMSNCGTGYLTTNFSAPVKPNAQAVTYRRCKVTVTDSAVAANTFGFNVTVNNSLTIGNLTFDGCMYHQDNNKLTTTLSPVVFGLITTATVRRYTIRNCKATIEAINWNNAASSNPIEIVGLQGPTVGLLEILGLDVRINGQISGAGSLLARVVAIDTSATVQFRIDGIDIDTSITGLGAVGTLYGMFFVPSSATTIGGSIRRLRFISQGADTSSKGLRFGSTTNLTISPGPITIEDCDFSGITAGGTEIQVDATQTALGAVVTRANKWKTKPAPVALTGLATGTGKLLGAAGATVMWRALVQLTQGSGSAITAVDYSTNGGTTYTNLLTQASGALPAGPGQLVGPLTPGDLLKATFTTTQPTVTLVPVDP